MIPTHLMPGKFVIKQEGDFNTTADLALGTNNSITLVANRDHNGAAIGFVYIDDGVSQTQPQAHFQLLLSANSIKKWEIRDDEGSEEKSFVSKFVITDAEDLKSTNFVCMTSQNSLDNVYLNYDYNETEKTLTIRDYNGSISLHDMKDIFFGDAEAEGNL